MRKWLVGPLASRTQFIAAVPDVRVVSHRNEVFHCTHIAVLFSLCCIRCVPTDEWSWFVLVSAEGEMAPTAISQVGKRRVRSINLIDKFFTLTTQMPDIM